MEIQQQLRTLGLHQTEIVIYLFLLKNGLSTPPVVSRETGIARTNCYNILLELKEKGLIEEKIQAKKKAYQANNPASLIELLKRKVADAQKIDPGVKFYQGLEQVQELYEKSLSAKSILSVGSRKRWRLLMPDFEERYFQEIQKRQIIFYDLTDSESKLMTAKIQNTLKSCYTVRQLPPEYEETALEILMWDDLIGFFNLKGSISAMLFKNQPLSDMLQMLFKIIRKKI